MEKFVNLIINDRGNEAASMVVTYKIEDGISDPEQALRDAIKDFVTSGTEEAKSALREACGCFNWGDAIIRVPDNYFIKHGLAPFQQDAEDVFVDHDEILCDDEPDETEGV